MVGIEFVKMSWATRFAVTAGWCGSAAYRCMHGCLVGDRTNQAYLVGEQSVREWRLNDAERGCEILVGYLKDAAFGSVLADWFVEILLDGYFHGCCG